MFSLSSRPALTPNREVAAVAWVPFDHLLDPATYHTARIDVRGAPREMPAYRLEETIVWGMTERILTALLAQLAPLARPRHSPASAPSSLDIRPSSAEY